MSVSPELSIQEAFLKRAFNGRSMLKDYKKKNMNQSNLGGSHVCELPLHQDFHLSLNFTGFSTTLGGAGAEST